MNRRIIIENRWKSGSRNPLRTILPLYFSWKQQNQFDGEITAIAIALQQLLLRTTAFKKAVLLVDSKSAIQTIASNKQATTQIVQETRRTIKLNKQDNTIVFQWIPSHVGIHRNETADLLAKKGTTLLSKRTTLNFETIKRFIKQKTQEKFFQEAITLSSKTQWQNINP